MLRVGPCLAVVLALRMGASDALCSQATPSQVEPGGGTIQFSATVVRIDSLSAGRAGLVRLAAPLDRSGLSLDARLFSEPAQLVIDGTTEMRLALGLRLRVASPCEAMASGSGVVAVSWGRLRASGRMTLGGPGRVVCALAGHDGGPDNAPRAVPLHEEIHVW